MRTYLRLSIDDDTDDYVVDYRITTGIRKGERATRTFNRFSDVVTFLILYISNNFLKND